MTDRLFGTDGVRGEANLDLTPELCLSIARAAAATTATPGDVAIIGMDTRKSGPMLESALAAGFSASGMNVLLAGVIPTPAISFLIKDERAALGAVISASHNPPQDNGIKLFDHRGMKLSVGEEEKIEGWIGEGTGYSGKPGTISLLPAAASRYAAFLTGAIDVEDIDLAGIRIVVDCAHGATGAIAPRVLSHFNAEVIELHTSPAGEKINQGCGSTHLEPLRAAVLEREAELGIAFDGDGDRVMLVSSTGETIDGDQMMGILALHGHRAGTLNPPLIVATVMSNLGLEDILRKKGISLLRTPVGDRNVARAMLTNKAKIGGEQSGHIILSDHSPTGDGILTSVKLLELAHSRGKDLASLAAAIPSYPQVKEDLAVQDKQAVLRDPSINGLIEQQQRELGNAGRILVRASGTQPVIRIMVEGKDESRCRRICNRLTEAIDSFR
jgi:phosphoglucosamine mutase